MKTTFRWFLPIFTVLLLLPLPVLAVNWGGSTWMTTGGGAPSFSGSAPSNGTLTGNVITPTLGDQLTINMGTFFQNSGSTSNLIADLSRDFSTGATFSALTITYSYLVTFDQGAFGIAPTGRPSGFFAELINRTGTPTTVRSLSFNTSGSANNLTLSFPLADLSANTNYTIRVYLGLRTTNSGANKGWNQPDLGAFSPFSFTFSGG